MKKIVIYSHSCEGTTGIDDEFFTYLKDKGGYEIVLIQFPFFHSKKGAIRVTLWNGKELRQRESTIKFYKPELISYLKDVVYGVYYGLKYARGAEFFFASNNLLAIVGVILRRLRVVKKVGCNLIDYTPTRYANRHLNNFYYAVDRYACYHSDIVFPLDEKTIMGRVEAGHLDIGKVKWEVVPFGNNSHHYTDDDYQHYDRTKIVYFGGVMKSKGAELFVPIMQALRAMGLDKTTFVCIGGGDNAYLRGAVKEAGLEKVFTIHGRVEDHHEVEKMLLGCGVAIAPYYPEDLNNFSYYADVGKVKVYIGCGLPVVITDVPPIAKKIQAEKVGVIADYSATAFAQAIQKLIADDTVYKQYRQRAIAFGRQFAWPLLFDQIMKHTLDE